MMEKEKVILRDASPYNAAITREQFLFYEMRTTAKLVCEGLSNDKIVYRIVQENLFQFPTEKSLRKMVLACLRRLQALRHHQRTEEALHYLLGQLYRILQRGYSGHRRLDFRHLRKR